MVRDSLTSKLPLRVGLIQNVGAELALLGNDVDDPDDANPPEKSVNPNVIGASLAAKAALVDSAMHEAKMPMKAKVLRARVMEGRRIMVPF